MNAPARFGAPPSSIPVVIDPEFQDLIPALKDEEHNQLEANIQAAGCRDPLVAWRTSVGLVLLDGHHRWAICQQHEIPYRVVEQIIADRDEAKLWILDNQAGRRNLNPYQRARLGLQKKELIASRAREHQREAGGAVPSTLTEAPIDTREEIAKAANVSTGTIHKVSKILERADDRTKKQLERGEKSISEVYKSIRRKERWEARDLRREQTVIEFPEGGNIITGDAELLHDRLGDGSVDLFLCDPPWDHAGIEENRVYDQLGRLAAAKLRPSGICLAYVGKMFIPTAIADMGKHLTYWWLFIIQHTGGNNQIWDRHIYTTFRPVLAFQKPPFAPAPNWVFDCVRGGGRDKDHHEWGRTSTK